MRKNNISDKNSKFKLLWKCANWSSFPQFAALSKNILFIWMKSSNKGQSSLLPSWEWHQKCYQCKEWACYTSNEHPAVSVSSTWQELVKSYNRIMLMPIYVCPPLCQVIKLEQKKNASSVIRIYIIFRLINQFQFKLVLWTIPLYVHYDNLKGKMWQRKRGIFPFG